MILGVATSASAKDVKHAYLRLAMKYHPDRAETGDDAKFKQIKAAYDAMKDGDYQVPSGSSGNTTGGPAEASAQSSQDRKEWQARQRRYESQFRQWQQQKGTRPKQYGQEQYAERAQAQGQQYYQYWEQGRGWQFRRYTAPDTAEERERIRRREAEAEAARAAFGSDLGRETETRPTARGLLSWALQTAAMYLVVFSVVYCWIYHEVECRRFLHSLGM